MFIAERKRVLANINIPLNSKSLLAKKSVTFQKSVKVYPTLHIRDYTLQQKYDTWYTWEETLYFKSNIHAELKMITTPTHLDDTQILFSFGLEYFTKSGRDLRTQRRRDSIDAVLNLQVLQKFRGYMDDVSLANDYANHTAESQKEAHRIGMADEQIVTSCNNEKSSSTT
jgi:hypothetical protein